MIVLGRPPRGGGFRRGGGGFRHRRRGGGGGPFYYSDDSWPVYIEPEIVPLPIPICSDGKPASLFTREGRPVCPEVKVEAKLKGMMLGAMTSTDISDTVDLAAITREIQNAVPVTYGTAKVLEQQGRDAIDAARSAAPSSWFVADQNAARDKVYWALNWHHDQIAKGDSNTLYPYADDLKKWDIAAFVEYNAATQGQAAMSAARAKFFSDSWYELRHGLPTATAGAASAASAVVAAAKKAVVALTPEPSTIALVVAGVLGVGAIVFIAATRRQPVLARRRRR